jgi:hypothetical protein
VYKKKTELAKKEYLKALAAYRATLVSKVEIESRSSIQSGIRLSLQSTSDNALSSYDLSVDFCRLLLIFVSITPSP